MYTYITKSHNMSGIGQISAPRVGWDSCIYQKKAYVTKAQKMKRALFETPFCKGPMCASESALRISKKGIYEQGTQDKKTLLYIYICMCKYIYISVHMYIYMYMYIYIHI